MKNEIKKFLLFQFFNFSESVQLVESLVESATCGYLFFAHSLLKYLMLLSSAPLLWVFDSHYDCLSMYSQRTLFYISNQTSVYTLYLYPELSNCIGSIYYSVDYFNFSSMECQAI